MSKYIAFDDETGGIDKSTSLLTVYFSVLDSSFNEIDSLDLALKPNDSKPYVVEPGGLLVNKINLIEHDKIAITYGDGGQKLRNLLVKHSNGGKDKLIPLGHNVHFDIDGINRNLLGEKTWNQYVSYRVLDTQVYARCLQIKGILPADLSISLGSLIEYFGIQLTGNQHESKYDTLATVEVFKRLIAL